MFDAFIKNQVAKWILRRLLELGGLGTFIVSLYAGLSPENQAVLWELIKGNTEGVSLQAVLGLASVIGGLVWNWRSTFKPHLMTADKQKAPLPELTLPEAKAIVRQATGREPNFVSKP